MTSRDAGPVVPSRGAMREITANTRRWSNTPNRPPGGQRAGPQRAPEIFLGVLDEELAADGVATASIWAYDPEADDYQESDLDVEVRGWQLDEQATLPEGTRVVISVVGAAAFVIAWRSEPTECVSTLEGRPVSDYPGFVEGAINVPYVAEDGCWAFTQPSTECEE